jgi:hypothetical protein
MRRWPEPALEAGADPPDRRHATHQSLLSQLPARALCGPAQRPAPNVEGASHSGRRAGAVTFYGMRTAAPESRPARRSSSAWFASVSAYS